HKSISRSLCRIQYSKQTALVRIGSRGAEPCRCESVLTSSAISWDVGSRIQVAFPIHMHDQVADVTGGHQPIRSKLPLDTQVPLVHVRHSCVWVEAVHVAVLR